MYSHKRQLGFSTHNIRKLSVAEQLGIGSLVKGVEGWTFKFSVK